MTNPITETGPTPLELLARQQETIEQLTATVERHQRQIEALWRRVQDLEGIRSLTTNRQADEHHRGSLGQAV